ncbi:MAG TPA: ABC transporter permease [Gemmatimonadaceae bacterium]|nr:ABC transporter permease [Gemmatimonadaceae bacterium]
MRRFVAVRLLHAIVVLFLVTTIAFFLIHLAPGDPFSFENASISSEVRNQWRAQFGYDRPLLEQYVRYLASVAQGKLGYSHSMHVPVVEALALRLPRTLLLMGLALILSFAIGIRLGVFEVRYWSTRKARASNAASLLVYSLPDFWLALMLLLIFGYWLPILPTGGMQDLVLHDYMTPSQAAWDRIKHMVLPLTTLTLLLGAAITRYQRASLLEVLPSDFVRTARAKGVDESRVIRRHALRNALLPMITLAGLALPALIGGALFVERVYSWPGMGLMVFTAIGVRDYPLVLASVIAGAVLVVVGNVLADIGYALADPRVRVH